MYDATPGPLWMLENKNDDESIKKKWLSNTYSWLLYQIYGKYHCLELLPIFKLALLTPFSAFLDNMRLKSVKPSKAEDWQRR